MAQRAETKHTPAQLFAFVFGAIYLFVGIAGFVVTGFDDFAGQTFDEELIIFALNPLHNIVHLAVGALWLGAATKHQTAKGVNMLIGVVYGLVAILGFAGALKFLAIESGAAPDNFLHLASSLLALYFGSAGAETTTSTPAT